MMEMILYIFPSISITFSGGREKKEKKNRNIHCNEISDKLRPISNPLTVGPQWSFGLYFRTRERKKTKDGVGLDSFGVPNDWGIRKIRKH